MDKLKDCKLGLIELKIGNTTIYKETQLHRDLYNEGFLIMPYGVQSIGIKPLGEMIGNKINNVK